MEHPKLYKIGLNKLCYSQELLLLYMLYGAMQAFIIYFSCVLVLNDVAVKNGMGQDQGFWLAGHVAYGCIIIKVNVMLQAKANIHFWLSVMWFVLMVAAYFVFFAIESELSFLPDIYMLCGQALSQPIVWIIFMLNASTSFLFEMSVKFYYVVFAAQNSFLYDTINSGDTERKKIGTSSNPIIIAIEKDLRDKLYK